MRLSTLSQFSKLPKAVTIPAIVLCSALLFGCGSSGSGTTSNTTSGTGTGAGTGTGTGSGTGSGSAQASSNQTFTVMDGLIQNATVCIDTNNNGVCDAGEVQGTTNASGAVTLAVPTNNTAPIIAVVPPTAIDQDTSAAVGTGYTLQVPASAANGGVISPLTTMVQNQMASGATLAQATATVASETGITTPLENYVKTSDSVAHTVAKSIVQIIQTQSNNLGSAAVGTKDPITGQVITPAQLNNALVVAIQPMLPSIVDALNTTGASTACASSITSTACLSALSSTVAALVPQMGLSTSNIAMVVGVQNGVTASDPSASTTPVASGSMKWLNFTDASNWYYRIMTATAAENTPDANGLLHYKDFHAGMGTGAIPLAGVTPGAGVAQNSLTGQLSDWSYGAGRPNTDVHWNGSVWEVCPVENSETPRNSAGQSTFNYCDGLQLGVSTRAPLDVSGKTIAQVVTLINNYPGADAYSEAFWGSNNNSVATPASALSSSTVVMPTGSTLYYYQQIATASAPVYVAGTVIGTNIVAATGGPCSSDANSKVASTTFNALFTVANGNACPNATALYSNSNYSMGLGSAVSNGVSVYYRASFPNGSSGNAVQYWQCPMLTSSSACTKYGTGTYSLQTLGSNTVMSFNNLPPALLALSSSRVFVQVGATGPVYYGYVQNLVPTAEVRLNLTAANTILSALNIAKVTPQ